MANNKNSNIQLVSVKQTIPDNIQPGGQTVSTSGTSVVGVGTSFLTVLAPGAWIVDLTQNEIRKVTEIMSDTTCKIESAFTSNLTAGTQFDYIPFKQLKEIAVASNPAGASYEIDGVTLFAGANPSWGKNSNPKTGLNDWIDPIIIDPGAGEILVETLKY